MSENPTRLQAILIPGWAGDDAKILAPHVPAGFIFVPSGGGIGHAPDEFTEPFELAAGAQFLLDTIRRIDATLTYA